MAATQARAHRGVRARTSEPNRAPSLRLTPRDSGRSLPLAVFEHAIGSEGSRYELIEGKVHVSPVPDLPHEAILEWINDRLRAYRDARPDVLNFVTTNSRVFIPGRRSATCPEPDLAAFRDFPLRLPPRQRTWKRMNPVLVVEVVSEDDPDKDLVRNVGLYVQSPSIREYWILDPRADMDRPSLRVFRKRGAAWLRPVDVPAGARYETRLLPGFSLRVDPHS
jgi:Uma2 family endonuclease